MMVLANAFSDSDRMWPVFRGCGAREREIRLLLDLDPSRPVGGHLHQHDIRESGEGRQYTVVEL